MHKKIFVKGETRTHVLLGRPQKIIINLYAQLTFVWQLKKPAYKAYKISHLVGL